MSRELRMRWLVAAAVLAVAQLASVTAEAQFFWDQQYQSRDQYQYRRARPQSGGFFQNWFSPYNSRPREDEYSQPRPRRQQHAQQPAESSRAPSPRQTESTVAPTTSIVVMGDDMADWLAYGLEDVFSDSPEISIVRKNKLYSGLLRYDAKGDLDWWHVARDTLGQEKADYVVMMVGVNDRQDIREKDLVKEAETRAKDQQAKDEAEKRTGQKTAKADDTQETGARVAQSGNKAGGPVEFRGDEWAKIYSRRIDDTITALKGKGVPVIWVGLPSIRGARSTADAAYLNDLYRARAERAGITYVDVWDGFVDEAGKYSNYGPDYEGQVRRLRLSDGVFFTKSGAVKLARYVEHELSRNISNRVPVALPSGLVEPAPSGAKPAERPLTGPVVPLTGGATPKDSDELLGGPGSSPIHGDATAVKVLAKGETVAAPPGRADNFAWPNGSEAKSARAAPEAPVTGQPNPEAVVAAKPKVVPAEAASALASAPADMKQQDRRKGSAGKLAQQKPAKKPPGVTRPRPPQDDFSRPPLPIEPLSGPWPRR
ncbi:MAG TPA: GDSL-type esterase/lipase family protein [Pseudolabrys sp.]|nr:GDSL-type esterase/lipase family protein [Pseudolabrys sp.]